MKIAVTTEFSTANRNAELVAALSRYDFEIFNMGMASPEDTTLDYVMTGLMAGLCINTRATDMVAGGCGSGQGYAISANQYPGVYCALILGPLDAFLASHINAPNVLSFPLSMFYGNAADRHLEMVLDNFFKDPLGAGYPAVRAGMQKDFRTDLQGVNKATHRPMIELLPDIDEKLLKTIMSVKPFAELMMDHGQDEEIKAFLKKFL